MDGLYTIGEISKIVKISTDALRYYDNIELVEPSYIDPYTRYRYYSEQQILMVLRIIELKQYGFSLDSIKIILKDDSQCLLDMYKLRYAELLQEKKDIEKGLNRLSYKITQIEEGIFMNKTIMLVDDAPIMRSMQKDMMERDGFIIVVEAENGADAVKKYTLLKPDLVVLDINMPEMNGIEALKKIKEIDAESKVIMCSAMGQKETVLQTLLSGASDFIVKPFQISALLSAVNNAYSNECVFNTDVIKGLLENTLCDDANDLMPLNQCEISELIVLCKS